MVQSLLAQLLPIALSTMLIESRPATDTPSLRYLLIRDNPGDTVSLRVVDDVRCTLYGIGSDADNWLVGDTVLAESRYRPGHFYRYRVTRISPPDDESYWAASCDIVEGELTAEEITFLKHAATRQVLHDTYADHDDHTSLVYAAA